MTWIREYLIHVTAAAMLCGIAVGLVGKKGTAAALTKLVAGLFLAAAVIGPLTGLRFSISEEIADPFRAEASIIISEAKQETEEKRKEIIKQELEAYILDKAAKLGVEVSVEVRLCDEELPLPTAVCVTGQAEPAVRTRLTQTIMQDMGITRENVIWK